VISVVDGMGVLLKKREDKDAIFGLPPHEVIAQNPLCGVHTMKSVDVKRIDRVSHEARGVDSLDDGLAFALPNL
jgi:hypothetical protein